MDGFSQIAHRLSNGQMNTAYRKYSQSAESSSRSELSLRPTRQSHPRHKRRNHQHQEWNGAGKVTKVVKGTTTISFLYDGMGNRVRKFVDKPSPQFDITTWYVRDASGNVMSTYEKTGSGNIKQIEVPLYGSDRVGMAKRSAERGTFTATDTSSRWLGYKMYELKDHLGNVRVVLGDKKTRTTGTNPFQPDVVSYSGYFPFGMQMQEDTWQSPLYRYGYNGKEKDGELHGEGNSYDYGARMYDVRRGQWGGMDPLAAKYPGISPFAFALNTPISAKDPDGKDVHIVIGDKPVGKTTIRLIGAEHVKGAPATIQVDLFKMTVTDDVTGKSSEYFVTRDAPVIDQKDPIDEQTMPTWMGGDVSYNVINTSFEPRGENKFVLKATNVEGEGAYVLTTKSGSQDLPAEPNESPFRTKKDVAKDIQIHVGGAYKDAQGRPRITGSEGCFTLQGKDAGNKGIKRLVEDIAQRKKENKKAGKGTKVDLEIIKRDNVKTRLIVDPDGTEGR